MKKKRVWWVSLSLWAVLLLTAGALWAMGTNQNAVVQDVSQLSAVPNRISYKGVYSENGVPVSGNRHMVFQLFSNSNCGGSPLQSITKNGVPLQNGLFHVVLDVNAAHFNGQALWLRVQIAGSNYGCEQILPSPYALYSASTDFHQLLGQTLTGLNNSLVITGTYSALPLTPGAPRGAPLVVSNVLTTGMGVRVLNATYGLYVDQAQWYGLWISQASLYGIVSHGNDIGVLGQAQSTGVNYGIYGNSASTSGTGVYGIATANSGATYGVYGTANSSGGRAVYGTHNNGNWGYLGGPFGAYGQHNNGNYGRLGTNNDGVVARSNVTGGYGVWAMQGPNASRAGTFSGNVHITGILSKGGGSFEIDHPLDPENRILRHSFVESPDMMNIYNGNVTVLKDLPKCSHLVLSSCFTESLTRPLHRLHFPPN
jgi:hypothetical protein